jgi:rhodanese-related sulfurtransferase
MVETTRLRELSPVDVDQLLRDGKILLIDVREPPEYAVERIKGALLFPLSSFDPAALPAAGDGEVVFHCGSGKRSAMAVARCLDRGFDHPAHMVGGIQGWKAAGLPTITDGTVQGS